MNTDRPLWDTAHKDRYAKAEWAHRPSIFVQTAITYFTPQGKILELGAGQGHDSIFLAQNGFDVLATDYSDSALEAIAHNTPTDLTGKLSKRFLDLSQPFPLDDSVYQAVYAHLSLHYFDSATTQAIFDEIYRILASKGIVATVLNTIDDPEYKDESATPLEQDFLKFSNGSQKRYFSPDTLAPFVSRFKTLLLDSKGESYKDTEAGVTSLIRFIGQKG